LLQREAAELHLWLWTDRHLAENTACYLRVSDIETTHRELLAAGLDRLSPPQKKPWGMVEFEVWDPSGQSAPLRRSANPRSLNRAPVLASLAAATVGRRIRAPR
jgi:hypothetical protein